MAADTFDAIVIGGGHNGLIAAAYLARAGRKVLVLERRPLVGGACVTEEVFPGYRVSTASYVVSLLRPEIIRDLGLKERGYEVIVRDPSSFSPYPGGRYLFFWRDADKTRAEISKFSERDAAQFADYERHLEELAELVEPLLRMPPIDPASRRWRDLWRLARLGLRMRKRSAELIRLSSLSVADYLDRWFESEELKVRLATDGVIGALAGPYTPGTAYVLFHHVMGQTEGQRGVWGYVRGGMGTISESIADYVRAKGGTIETEADVARIVVKGERAEGVLLRDGREFQAKAVLSNADPKRTFLQLFDPLDLPEELVDDVRRLRMASGSVKINIAASGLPNFHAYPGTKAGPQHQGTIHLCPSLDYMEDAFEDAKRGRPSKKPVVEMCIPSVVDPSLAPDGKHLISLFVQYAPYKLADGKQWDDAAERNFANSVFAVIREYVTNWDEIVDEYQILTPKGIEDRFGMTGGNIFHGEMTLDQLLFMRPFPTCARYGTPIKDFYLCGSGVHPGGGVLGTPGYLAAKAALRKSL
ncbi:Phytoene desaturase (lycopene-forming) [Planctomycetes bacterium Pan216]|uniref:Pyridine nucleotide-disulfide oxidoreductase domain-containing protein 2 n=1 Tax=Kolteria novifilia TaxID=2527975 RepID=A0A518AX15_9BACT|nr:Phytoene desaturase (lycopene-forming) [Planctomycetes bacterium Pan216]